MTETKLEGGFRSVIQWRSSEVESIHRFRRLGLGRGSRRLEEIWHDRFAARSGDCACFDAEAFLDDWCQRCEEARSMAERAQHATLKTHGS